MACAFVRFETTEMGEQAILGVHGRVSFPGGEVLVARWADAPRSNRRRVDDMNIRHLQPMQHQEQLRQSQQLQQQQTRRDRQQPYMVHGGYYRGQPYPPAQQYMGIMPQMMHYPMVEPHMSSGSYNMRLGYPAQSSALPQSGVMDAWEQQRQMAALGNSWLPMRQCYMGPGMHATSSESPEHLHLGSPTVNPYAVAGASQQIRGTSSAAAQSAALQSPALPVSPPAPLAGLGNALPMLPPSDARTERVGVGMHSVISGAPRSLEGSGGASAPALELADQFRADSSSSSQRGHSAEDPSPLEN